MVDLKEKPPLCEEEPEQIGDVTLSECPMRQMTLIAPYKGRVKQLSSAMNARFGLEFPQPGAVTEAAGVRCVWMGREQAMLIGGKPDDAWQEQAMICDQSDGWVVLSIEGKAADAVLARLIPIDLRRLQGAARSLCGHIPVVVIRISATQLEVMAYRSMAQSLWDEVSTAAGLLAARKLLS